MSADFSKMTSRVAFQGAAETTDAQGSVSRVWSTVAEVWAEVLDSKSGRVAEVTSADQRTATDRKTVRIRYSSAVAGIDATHRIVYRGAKYDITAPPDLVPADRPETMLFHAAATTP